MDITQNNITTGQLKDIRSVSCICNKRCSAYRASTCRHWKGDNSVVCTRFQGMGPCEQMKKRFRLISLFRGATLRDNVKRYRS